MISEAFMQNQDTFLTSKLSRHGRTSCIYGRRNEEQSKIRTLSHSDKKDARTLTQGGDTYQPSE